MAKEGGSQSAHAHRRMTTMDSDGNLLDRASEASTSTIFNGNWTVGKRLSSPTSGGLSQASAETRALARGRSDHRVQNRSLLQNYLYK